MTSQVAEWVSKAEGDFATAGRELRAPNLLIMMQSVFMHNSAQRNISKLYYRKAKNIFLRFTT